MATFGGDLKSTLGNPNGLTSGCIGTGFTIPRGPSLSVDGVDILTMSGRLGGPTYGAITSRNFHPGGAVSLYADSSVRFTQETSDGWIGRARGTVAGNEVHPGN